MILSAAIAVVAIAAPGHAHVAVVDNAFKARAVTVRRGGAVTWRWRGHRRHDVWFQSGPARCSSRRSGTCTRRFRRAGRYEYFCTIHGTMTGVVRVRR